MRGVLIAIALVVLTGCATSIPSVTVSDHIKSSSTALVGDRGTIQLQEIVVSVQLEGEKPVIQNLHVGLAAVINSDKLLANYNDINTLVRRSEARIRAAVIDEATREKLDGNIVADLNRRIGDRANKTLQPIYAKWKYAPDYPITIVVTSLYFASEAPQRQPDLGFYY